MTTARNSDDAIASLMQEMGEQQGYDQHQHDTMTMTTTTVRVQAAAKIDHDNDNDNGNNNNANADDDETNTGEITVTDDHHHQLLLRQQQQQSHYHYQPLLIPELLDYPNNHFMAGSQSIWNPLVMSSDGDNGGDSGDSGGNGGNGGGGNGGNGDKYGYGLLSLPTNPQIEIIRRRVYEKFRQEVTILLQDIQSKLLPSSQFVMGGGTGGGKGTGSSSSSSFSKNKNKLPIPSMLDKWHMDSKLDERNNLIIIQQQQQQQQAAAANDDLSVSMIMTSTSTVDILRELTRRKQQQQQHGGDAYYDPILLNKHSPTIFVDSILKPNIEKLWAEHHHGGNGNNDNNNKGNNNNNNNNLPPKFNKKSKQIHKGLYRLVCEAMDTFEMQLHQVVRQESIRSSRMNNKNKNKNKNNNSRLPKISLSSTDENGGGDSSSTSMSTSSSSLVRVTYSGVTLKLHSAYLEKLQRLYDRTQQRRQQQQQHSQQQQQQQQQQRGSTLCLTFEESLFCLLCRYDMIQGAGLQAGVPGSVMDILLKQFNCKKECFASPLNCRYDTFSSAFYDIDYYFGSSGSFFELKVPVGASAAATATAVAGASTKDEGICYQANPPFCEGLILQLNNKITDILLSSQQQQKQQQQQQQRPIMFVVFVPAWHESICYQALRANKYLTQHMLLKQGQHWYAEGTQHRRKDSFRVASFDTSILFYQNESAKQLWNLQNQKQDSSSTTDINNGVDAILLQGNVVLDELRNAFCQDPGIMQKEEQQQQQQETTSRINKPRRSNFVTTTKATTSTSTITSRNFVTSSTHDDEPSENIPSSSFSVDINKQKNRNKKFHAKKLSPAKKERKRKWNQQEEGKAQLDLLESLGLSSSTTTSATTAATTTTKSSQEGSRTVSAEDNKNNNSNNKKKLRPSGKTNNKNEKLLSRKMKKKKRPHR